MVHGHSAPSGIPLRGLRSRLPLQGPFVEGRPADCAACALRRAGLFARLAPDELDHRLQPIRSGFCPASQVIYRAGEPATAAYTIRSGVVKLLRRAPDGEERIVRLLGRGATIGLEALDGGRYANTAVATRESNLCWIPHVVLADLGRRSPGFHVGLARQWRAHAVQSEIWASRLHGGALDERALWLIGQLCEVSGDPAEAVRLLRNEDLADLLARLQRGGPISRIGP